MTATPAATIVPSSRPRPSLTSLPSPTPRPTPRPLSSAALRDAIDADAIREHLGALEQLTLAHGGNRAAGSAGYAAAVGYVAERLVAAGYRVERPTFAFTADGTEVRSSNVIAELPGARAEDHGVLMLGAHLDSVPHRAGINDNGSGTMTLLTLAERLVELDRPPRTVRFAFWGAEEPGLKGSSAYVSSLGPDERERIVAYLNFDMLGSPNFVRFVYDDRLAAPGSAAITQLFADHFDAAGLAWDTFDLSGKTDQAPFSSAGIPTGGLFSGGGELKTDAQAATMGGTAGVPADACDDAACDTADNVSDAALDQMADAIAHAIASLAGVDQ